LQNRNASFLDTLTPDERDLITGLIYRAGIFISLAEGAVDDNDKDEEIEQHALLSTFVLLARSRDAHPLVHEIARAVLAARDRWPDWAAMAESTPADCRNLINVMANKMTVGQFKIYRRFLLKVASSVAGSYGEFGAEDETFWKRLRRVVRAAFIESDYSHMNISPAEAEAIEELRQAMSFREEAADTSAAPNVSGVVAQK
jgi:hypothetical protein